MLFSLILFFKELMHPQNDKIGVLEVLEIKTVSSAQPWWADVLRILYVYFIVQLLLP